jgi:hypothetical protein
MPFDLPDYDQYAARRVNAYLWIQMGDHVAEDVARSYCLDAVDPPAGSCTRFESSVGPSAVFANVDRT